MSLDALPINAFDFMLLAVIALGILRGRKHGMSEELMGLITWLAVLFGCAMLYEPVGTFVANSSPFSLLSSFLMAYIGTAIIILAAFALLKRSLGGKLIGSDIFGRSEYYLGMASGLVRVCCMLLAALALLNARYFSPQEIQARERYQNELYGSTYFPGLQSVQSVVFEKSLVGPWIRENLNFLLIKPTRPENKDIHQQDYKMP